MDAMEGPEMGKKDAMLMAAILAGIIGLGIAAALLAPHFMS
jgi:hypothetical protein